MKKLFATKYTWNVCIDALDLFHMLSFCLGVWLVGILVGWW